MSPEVGRLMSSTRRVSQVGLRDVVEDDIAVFFEQQRDPIATTMAGFPARVREAHDQHWAKILADETVVARAVTANGQVVGNIVSWEQDGEREIGYWIGRQHWGRGIATAALREFVVEVADRPLYAHVTAQNTGSIRVLEKCGFVARDGGGLTEDDGEICMELRDSQ